jgi:hypothetical protein
MSSSVADYCLRLCDSLASVLFAWVVLLTTWVAWAGA